MGDNGLAELFDMGGLTSCYFAGFVLVVMQKLEGWSTLMSEQLGPELPLMLRSQAGVGTGRCT